MFLVLHSVVHICWHCIKQHPGCVFIQLKSKIHGSGPSCAHLSSSGFLSGGQFAARPSYPGHTTSWHLPHSSSSHETPGPEQGETGAANFLQRPAQPIVRQLVTSDWSPRVIQGFLLAEAGSQVCKVWEDSQAACLWQDVTPETHTLVTPCSTRHQAPEVSARGLGSWVASVASSKHAAHDANIVISPLCWIAAFMQRAPCVELGFARAYSKRLPILCQIWPRTFLPDLGQMGHGDEKTFYSF